MTPHSHRITSAIALALALAGTVAPVAWADPPPLAQAEAAIAAHRHPASRAPVANGANIIASPRPTPAPEATHHSEFDWGDAGIGAGGMLALSTLGLAGTLATTRRRNHHASRQQTSPTSDSSIARA
jgi:hypothetical protein